MILSRLKGLVAATLSLAVLLLTTPALAAETRPQGIGPRAPAPTGVLVNLPARTLYWYREGKLVRAFPVGIGKYSSQTPLGSYKVQNKAKNPWWQPPWGGDPVAPGPANPLGTRWIGFNGEYGIHGNNNPASIGSLVSLGCIRMYIPDVEWLYDQVSVGTPVTVVYEPIQLLYGEDGRRYLAIYHDVYEMGGRSTAAVLTGAGIEADAVVSGAAPGRYALDAAATVNGEAIPTILHQGKAYLAARLLAGKVTAGLAWDAATSTVSLDGQPLPTVVRGSTGYVEAEGAAAALGVAYSGSEDQVTITAGSPVFLKGALLGRWGQPGEGGETLLPVRAVAEAAGAAVGWNAETREALVGGEPVPTVLIAGRAYTGAAVLAARLALSMTVDGPSIHLNP